ncbi:MAG: mechanosensitive ion channel family protein [Nitrospinota bacterium]|nr:mechanosensitive ion channel family protein [Nitrospinota bacterium]
MESIDNMLDMALPGLTMWQLSLSVIVILFTFFLRRPILDRSLKWMENLAAKYEGEWDEEFTHSIGQPLNVLILVYGLLLSLNVLPLPQKPVNIAGFVDMAELMTVLVLGLWLFSRMISAMDKVIRKRALDPEHWLDAGLAPFITISLRIIVFVTGVIVIAQNLGYSVSGLVASLGLGAAALALASKDTVANLFGSLMIMMDKPFQVGDWIRGSGFEGTVEEIGLRSTRIRTFDKTVQNVPNNLLANVIIENMDRRKDKDLNMRRVSIIIGIAQTATADQMEELVDQVKNLLMEEPMVNKSYEPMVYFSDFGQSSYDLMVYYFAHTDWRTWLKAKQTVNIKIIRKLEEMGLSLAYTTQTVYLEGKDNARALLGGDGIASIPQESRTGKEPE